MSDQLIPPGSKIIDLRVVGDDVEADLPILKKPYAMRILHSLYDHAASKVECPDKRDQMKPEAREAIADLLAADLIVAHPVHDAQVTQNIKMFCKTIALTERGRNVVEAHRNRKIVVGKQDGDTDADLLS
jgi:hypothetical protein